MNWLPKAANRKASEHHRAPLEAEAEVRLKIVLEIDDNHTPGHATRNALQEDKQRRRRPKDRGEITLCRFGARAHLHHHSSSGHRGAKPSPPWFHERNPDDDGEGDEQNTDDYEGCPP